MSRSSTHLKLNFGLFLSLAWRNAPRDATDYSANDGVELAHNYQCGEAERLKQTALEIRDLRTEFGQPNMLAEGFLPYCSLRGSNVPGEPTLAKSFLDEIGRGNFLPF
jgi:hypothetical protein